MKALPKQTHAVVDVAFGGDGIAREDGKVIFITGAVPGETVEVEIYSDKKRFLKGRALKTIEASEDSVSAFCPVFSRCGGCEWQHVPYPKQLDWKSGFISSALQKTAKIAISEKIAVRPSNLLQGFRNRIKLKARLKEGRFEFSYFARGSHDHIKVNSCPIADPSINELLSDLQHCVLPNEVSWRGEVEIQAVLDKRRLVHFSPNFPNLDVLKLEFPKDFFDPLGSVPFERHEGTTYLTRAGQFQQVNLEGNHALRQWILHKVEAIAPKTLVDLFCGSGNLSLGLNRVTNLKVWGVEFSETAIRTADDNVLENKREGFQYRAAPANQIRSLFPDLPESIDCVITDPPRQGMDDSIEDLLALLPKHILSVSCDPNTFARDLKRLMECGYVPRDIQGLDFFPHSYHVETLAHLEYDSKADSRLIQG